MLELFVPGCYRSGKRGGVGFIGDGGFELGAVLGPLVRVCSLDVDRQGFVAGFVFVGEL